MPTGERFRSGDDASMKSYGMPDESWDEAKIRALIKEAIHATRKRGIPVAVHQDERGDVVMSRARIKHSFMYACVAIAYVDKRTMGYATELTGNVPHERYTVGQMDPEDARRPGTGDIRVRRVGLVSDGAKTRALGSQVRRKAGQDAQGAVHRGRDG